jgi:outer membrane cobalamin receptor
MRAGHNLDSVSVKTFPNTIGSGEKAGKLLSGFSFRFASLGTRPTKNVSLWGFSTLPSAGMTVGSGAALPFTVGRLLAACVIVLLAQMSNVRAQSTLDIAGRVIDCTTSQPISGAWLAIEGQPDVVVSDADGGFRCYNIKPGIHKAHIEAPAYHPRSNIEIVVNSDFSPDIVLCLDPVLYSAPAQRIHAQSDPMPARTVVIDRSSPQFDVAGNVEELIEHIPGLIVNSTGSKDGESSISVRGGPSREVLVLVDGVRINSPVTGAADLNSVPLSSVEKIEFTDGGGSSQYGSGAVGGVLCIVTGAASDSDALETDGSGGSYDSRKWNGAARLGAGRPVGMSAGWSQYTCANNFMFDDPKSGIQRRENADVWRMNAFATADIDVGRVPRYAARNEKPDTDEKASTLLRFRYSRFEQDNGVAGYLYQLNPTARKEQTRELLSAGIERDAGDLFLSARYSLKLDDQTFFDTSSYLKTDSRYLDRLHQVDTRADLRVLGHTRIESSASAAWESFDVDNHLGRPTSADDAVERRSSISAASHSRFSRATAGIMTAADVRTQIRGDYSSLYGPTYSPSVTVGTDLTRWAKLRVESSYGRSHNAPLYTSLFWDDGVFAVGNPNLRPEKLQESSSLVKLSIPAWGELATEWRYSHSAYEDLIYWIRTSDNKYSPRNLSGAIVFTKSVSVTWSCPALGLSLDYSNIDQTSKDRSWQRTHHNGQLLYRPRFLQYLSLRHSNRYLELTYRYRHVSKRFIREANTKWLDGYDVADATVAVKYALPWVNLRVQYEIDNLTDAGYMLVERLPQPGSTWSISVRLSFPLSIDSRR